MNDAEFRRRAHALLERCVVREEATGTKWTGELRALLADGAAHRTCDCAYPPAHRPECPELRGTALDVAMRAARAREVATAGGTSFTTHDMSSRPVTINIGGQPRCGVALRGDTSEPTECGLPAGHDCRHMSVCEECHGRGRLTCPCETCGQRRWVTQ